MPPFDIDDMVQCIDVSNSNGDKNVERLVLNGVYFVYNIRFCGAIEVSPDSGMLRSSRFELVKDGVAWPLE